MGFSKKNPQSKTPLKELTPEQLAIVQKIWLGIRQWKQRPLGMVILSISS